MDLHAEMGFKPFWDSDLLCYTHHYRKGGGESRDY